MIWVVFTMVLNPILPRLSELHYEGNSREFRHRILWLIGATFVFCIIYLAFMYFIGIQIFGIIYKVPLLTHRLEFVLVGVGSGILCIATIFSNLLIMIRKMKILLISYTIAAVLSAVTSTYLVIAKGLLGATLSYLIMMSVLMVILAAGYFFADRHNRYKGQA
jgi:O-antigen/teichoic acid export membrane protein